MNKCFTFVLVLVLASSSLMAVKPAQSSTTKSSVPEFTVKLVAHPYDVPTTYGIDPYTGKNVTIQEGHHVENKSIEVTIKNQPFSPYKDANGSYIGLYYNVSYRGHYGNDWSYYPNYGGWYPASHYEYTVIAFGFGGNNQSSYTSSSQAELGADISPGGQVDFQVQAIIGNVTEIHTGFIMFGTEVINYDVITVETSGWSNTQTITIPASAASPTIQLLAIIGTVIAVVVVSAGLLGYLKKRKREAGHT
jgi:hypothetical protein